MQQSSRQLDIKSTSSSSPLIDNNSNTNISDPSGTETAANNGKICDGCDKQQQQDIDDIPDLTRQTRRFSIGPQPYPYRQDDEDEHDEDPDEMPPQYYAHHQRMAYGFDQDLQQDQVAYYLGQQAGKQEGWNGDMGDPSNVHDVMGDEDDDDEDDDDIDYDPDKKVIVGICAMEKKAQSKPMKEILRRLEDYFEYIQTLVFEESVILNKPIEEWPLCDCLISFHSKGFPLSKAIEYARLRRPFLVNDLDIQYDIQDRRKVYKKLEEAETELPRYVVLDRDSSSLEERELIEGDDQIEIGNFVLNKPFVEKPISAEDHNICIYYPSHAGGGSQRLFRKIGCRSSVYSNESHVRKTGSYIYEEFMPTDGTDVKVYTAGPDYAHAEARKSPALDGKVERDMDGKEIRYPVILTNKEKLIARRVCLAFKQTVCGFDLLRANGNSYVCDVNGFSFVKSSMKYYEDCSKILGNMMLRALAPQLHIPWSIPFQLDDPPIVPTTFGRMMELRCVIAVIRHGDRTPKQKMKLEVKHRKFFELYEKYGNPKSGQAKLKKPKQLQEVLDIARYLLGEISATEASAKDTPEVASNVQQQRSNIQLDDVMDANSCASQLSHEASLDGSSSLTDPPRRPEVVQEPRVKLRQLKSVLEMYGHFSGINRKVQLKYQPHGRPRRSSSDDEASREPSLVLILKWGGELTPAGRVQAEDLGRCFRRLYPASGDYSGPQGLGLLRLHSTFRHDLKIYASDEGRVQMTAAAFAKGFLALEGELTPILFQMVKSANTNGLLDDDDDYCGESSKSQKLAKQKLHDIMQQDREFTDDDLGQLNPTNAPSIKDACAFIKNPREACEKVHSLIKELNTLIRSKRQETSGYAQEYHLYHGETWDLLQRRWAKLEKDFKMHKSKRFDISKVPDIYDCIKYDLQHNQHTLQFVFAHELYTYAKALADIVIPQEYGISEREKLTVSLGTCSPLLRKIQADLLRNSDQLCTDDETESVNRLDPKYSHGVSSPDRHVRTRLYFTSESHIHSLITALEFGGLLDTQHDEQWKRSMEFLSAISELNYLSQIVIMLYEDPSKEYSRDDRFHVEIHFSSGVINRTNQNYNVGANNEPQGPGFRPHVNTNKSFGSPAAATATTGALGLAGSESTTQQQQRSRERSFSSLSNDSAEGTSLGGVTTASGCAVVGDVAIPGQLVIREEPIDEERNSNEGLSSGANSNNGHSQSSIAQSVTPIKSPPPTASGAEADTGVKLDTNLTADAKCPSSRKLPPLSGPTRANSNQTSTSGFGAPRCLARSYSAITPISLEESFNRKSPLRVDIKSDIESIEDSPLPPLAVRRDIEATSGETKLTLGLNGSTSKNQMLPPPPPQQPHSGAAGTRLVSSNSVSFRRRNNPNLTMSGAMYNHADSLPSAGYYTGSSQSGQQLQQPAQSPTSLSARVPNSMSIAAAATSSSMSTSPQLLHHHHHLQHQQHQFHGHLLSSRFRHHQQGSSVGRNLYLTMSSSMPSGHKSAGNPRACSVADVSQYCVGPSSLISTAVISGSSPELVAMCPYSPNIRPLETLHNELSLRQFNDFITKLTKNHRSSQANLLHCSNSQNSCT